MNINHLVKTTFVLALSSLVTQVSAVPIDFGYRFIHNNVGVRDLAPNYGPVYAGAGTDFSNAGNLTFFSVVPANLNPPYTGHVAFEEGNFGASGWVGIAVGYTVLNQPCIELTSGIPTGNCTMANGADYGHIRFNTFYYPNPSIAEMNFIIRHEFGHILGLGHDPVCTPSTSVMVYSFGCTPMHTTLQADDINLINAWYP